MMKLQGQPATMITSVAIPSWCTTLILMAVGHQKTGKRILGHLHKKETREPSTRGLASTVNEVAHQAEVVAAVEVLTHKSPHTAYIMAAKLTTT
jgi:hypothetical protein